MNMQSTTATACICAGLLAFQSLPASAGWALTANNNQLTNDVWKLNVGVSGTNITITGVASVVGTNVVDFTDGVTDASGGVTYAVTAVGGDAFNTKNAIAGLRAPQLTSIGLNGFYACRNLAFVEFGGGLATIEGYAFTGCSALESVTGVGGGLKTIGEVAFSGCTRLKTFEPGTLPNLATLGRGAFSNCSALESGFDMPSLKSVPSDCFNSCRKLTYFHAPKVTAVNGNAFYSCGNLGSITIGGGGAIAGWSMNGIKAGAVLRFMGEAPTSIGGAALVPSGNNYMVVLVEHSRYLAGWDGKYVPYENLTSDQQRTRPTAYKARRAKGLVKHGGSAANAWLIDDDNAAQTILTVQ